MLDFDREEGNDCWVACGRERGSEEQNRNGWGSVIESERAVERIAYVKEMARKSG